MTPEDNTTIARPKVETRKRSFSLVWLMPVLAIVISGYVVWNNYNDRGPLITIVLQSGAGISAGATEVRIRDLKVGVVEDIGFSDGMTAVEVNVRLDKDIAGYVDKDAQFWLVEPQVTARGVTGIGTLLSGVYIAANWDGVEGEFQDRFTALTVPPLASIGEEGTRIVLRARAGGQLAAGAPVLTSGLEVGRIGQPELSKTGNTVTMEAFIFKPYDARLTSNTRFWDASGLSLNLGAQGLALKVDSLAALIEGGVTFGEPVTGGQPVSDGQVFDVFPTEAAARENAFEANVLPGINLSVLLEGDINGLNLDTAATIRFGYALICGCRRHGSAFRAIKRQMKPLHSSRHGLPTACARVSGRRACSGKRSFWNWYGCRSSRPPRSPRAKTDGCICRRHQPQRLIQTPV